MSPSSPLRFYFDPISSNAYLAWVALEPLAERYGRRIEPVPVLFAGLLSAHGQLGPAEVAPKRRWMALNNRRKAAVLGVPLEPPAAHPFNPLWALRAASLPMPEATRVALTGALLRAVWAERRDVSDPEVVRELLTRVGLDGHQALREAGSEEGKRRLRRATDAALEAGVFGVPTLVVDGQLFWGYDDFPWLERFLAGEDPIDAAETLRFMEASPVPRGAWRKEGPRD